MLLRATKRHALLHCRLRAVLHGCYAGQSCNIVSWRFLWSLFQQGATLHTVGFLAWATAYIAVRKHEARQRVVQDGATVVAQGPKQTAAMGATGRQHAPVRQTAHHTCHLPKIVQQAEQQLSVQDTAETSPSMWTSTPCSGAAAAAAGAVAAAEVAREGLVPLETLGIYALRTFGFDSTLCWLDEQAARLADRIDEAIIVRSVCLPVVAYSLTYVVLARVQFLVRGREGAFMPDRACR